VFLGHIGVALAAKRVAPRTSLGVLVGAAVLLDLVWPVLVLAGIEVVRVEPGNTAFTPLAFEHYPITHGALAVVVWSLAAGAVHHARSGDARAATTVGALVASHWLLDLVAHRPDLPLVWGGVRVGLGLWGSIPATLAVELAIFAAGIAVYARATRARDRTGAAALVALVLFLLAVYAANVLGPPPPSARAVGAAGLAQWLLVLWAWWVDRHRAPANAPAGALTA
jgi:hypothetical protein